MKGESDVNEPASTSASGGATTPSPDAPASRFVEVGGGGRIVHCLDFGGSGPPLLFSHGTGLHARTWRTHARALGDAFRCFALDHRGHGDSPPDAAGDYRWAAMGEDLAGVVAALGLDRPLLVGHSMGGAVGIFAEARRPGAFRGMVLVDPIVLPPPVYAGPPPTYETQPMAKRTIRRRERWDSPEQAIEAYRAKPPFDVWKPAELENYVRGGTRPDPEGGVRLKCAARIEADTYIGGHAVDPWPLLPGIAIPVLVLQGTAADTRAVVDARKIAATMPRGRFEAVEGATHFLPMDSPEALIEAIRRFARAEKIGGAGL